MAQLSEEEIRDFLRKRITNISTAAEDDIIGLCRQYAEEREAAAHDQGLNKGINGLENVVASDEKNKTALYHIRFLRRLLTSPLPNTESDKKSKKKRT